MNALFTILGACAMVLVIAQHVPSLPKGPILSLAVPWFFFVSGIRLAQKFRAHRSLQDASVIWRTETAKRVKSLLVPFFLWNLLWLPILEVANWVGWRYCGANRVVDFTLPCLVRCVGLSPAAWPALVPTWFLRALFCVAALVGGVWTLGRGSRVVFVFAAVASGALCLTQNLWCPASPALDGFFRFGLPLQGLAAFTLGGAIAVFFPPPTKNASSPLIDTIRRSLMPVYLLHVPIIVSLGWIAKALHIFSLLTTPAGDFISGCLGVLGALVIARLLRRHTPRLASLLFGGR